MSNAAETSQPKTHRPLVVGSYDQVSSLIHGNLDLITVGPAKDLGEEDPQLNLKAMVMFYHYSPETGHLEAVQYQVTDRDEKGEETNHGATSTVFGGDVEVGDVLECTETVVLENGDHEFHMNLEQFSTSVASLALKTAETFLGCEVPFIIQKENVSVFSTPKAQDEDRASLMVYATIPVTKEQLDKMVAVDTFDKEVVNRVGMMGVSVGDLIISFNLERAVNEFTDQLIQQHAMTVVAGSIVRFLVIQCINESVGEISYAAVRKAVELIKAEAPKVEERQSQLAEHAE